MAVLVEEDRVDVWARYMRENDGVATVNKPDLRAAVDAIDDWVNANAASFNTAIPQPARGALTAKQKARLLMMVVKKRFEKN